MKKSSKTQAPFKLPTANNDAIVAAIKALTKGFQ
jgi:hypothetical protein